MKFKAGDRIRLTEEVRQYMGTGLYEPPPGTTGTIIETHHYPVYGVALEDGVPGTALSGYHDEEMELENS